MKYPEVDRDLCIGCGACAELCPEVFQMRDDEKAWVTGYDQCDTCNCREAINLCPVRAIRWSEE